MAIEAQESAEGRREKVAFLIEHLLTEMPAYREEAEHVPDVEQAQRDFLRALMNVRPPIPLQAEFLRVQDALLTEEREARGVVNGAALPTVAEERCTTMARGAASGAGMDTADENFVLWQGDITRLAVDAIVNAANSALLGCFVPLHSPFAPPAMKSCGNKGIRSLPGARRSRRVSICPRVMCFIRSARSSRPWEVLSMSRAYSRASRTRRSNVSPRATARASTSRRSMG